MKRDLMFDLASLFSRASLCYVISAFLCLGRPMDGAAAAVTAGLVLCTAVLYYIFRRLFYNPLVFCAAHIGVAAVAFFVIPAGFTFGFAAGLVFLLADSFYCRLKKSGPEEYAVHWALAVFLCVLYIVGAAYGMKQFTTICFYGVVCFLSLYFLQTGLLRTNSFLEDNKELSNVPFVKIRSQAGAVLFVFAAVTAAVMAVVPKTVLMSAVTAVQNGILFLIRMVLGKIDVGKPSEIQQAEQIDLGGVFNAGIFEKSGEISPIWDILDNIVFILVYAAIIIGAIALAVFVYGRVKALFAGAKETDKDVTERIVPDKVERAFVRRGAKARKKAAISGSAENVKIRKLYRRFVQSALPEGVAQSATPGEISEKAGGGDVQAIYEKARYGKEPCGKEDTERLKALVKGK